VCILPTLSHVTDAFVLAEVDHLTSRARLCLLSPKAAFSEKEQVKLMGLTRESIQEPKMAGPFIEEDSADEEEEKTAVGDLAPSTTLPGSPINISDEDQGSDGSAIR
jgi:hypothetical protein